MLTARDKNYIFFPPQFRVISTGVMRVFFWQLGIDDTASVKSDKGKDNVFTRFNSILAKSLPLNTSTIVRIRQ